MDVVQETKDEPSEAEKQAYIDTLLEHLRKIRSSEQHFIQNDFFATFDATKEKQLLRQMMQFYHPDKASREANQRYEEITKELSVIKTNAKNGSVPILVGLKNAYANFEDFIEYYQSTQ